MPGPRLVFLDGLRGLAALYVVFHHAAMMVPPAGLSGPALAARFLLRHGHSAVAVFVVLSGYCLMLPVVRDPGGRLPGGSLAFLGRRARRILPPYYAALALCLFLSVARDVGVRASPAAGSGVVVSHLLLIHNLRDRWIFQIAPPFWSVATEWQIYLLFPALLAIWRRLGMFATVAAGFALGYALAALAPSLGNPALRHLCPWYAGLFALGMAAAVATDRRRPADVAGARPRGLAGAGMGLVALIFAGLAIAGTGDRAFLIGDPLVGAATARLIVRGARRPVFRLLEDRRAAALGAISYSLYLVHYPLLVLTDAASRACGAGPGARLAILLLVASPLCIPAASLFHACFERPSSWSRRRPRTIPTATVPAIGR